MTRIGSAIAILFYFFLSVVYAQDGIVVQINADRDRMELGDTFTVTVTVQSSDVVEADEPHLPALTDFELVQQWENKSVQQQLLSTPNGMDWQTVRKNQFHYMFLTKREGRLSIDAFEVVVNGKLFRTQPVMVEVLPKGQGPKAQVPRAQPGIPTLEDEEERFLQEQEEIFNQMLRRRPAPRIFGAPGAPGSNQSGKEPEFRSMPTSEKDAFFIQVEVDKKSVYEGEQVTVSWYLLTRGQIETLDRVKFPNLKGFWKEIIEENPQIQFFEEIINGAVYRKALLASHALFPIRPGKAVVDEFTVKSRVRLPTQGFGFGYGRPYDYTKSSKRFEVEVKPLPLDGRPSQFTGAVGTFEVHAQVETQKTAANQPFSLKVRFEGQGNAKSIELPKIEWPEGLELYDTKNESRFFKDGKSYKEFEILLIPRKAGPMEIPAIEFAFFNPQTEKYEVRKTDPIKLEISGALNVDPQQGENFLDKKENAKKVFSLPPLLVTPDSFRQSSPFSAANAWNLVLFLSLLGLAGFGVKEMRPQNRAVSLRKMLDHQWVKVEEAQAKSAYRQLGTEIVNAFNLVLSEITSHKGEILEIDKMLEKLTPSTREKYAAAIKEIYENAQLLSFAPDAIVEKASQHENLPALIKRARQVLNTLCG